MGTSVEADTTDTTYIDSLEYKSRNPQQKLSLRGIPTSKYVYVGIPHAMYIDVIQYM